MKKLTKNICFFFIMAIKVYKDKLKRSVFKCDATGTLLLSAFIYNDKVFINPIAALWYFSFCAPKLALKERERIAGDLIELAGIEDELTESGFEKEIDFKWFESHECAKLISREYPVIAASEYSLVNDDAEKNAKPKKIGYVYKMTHEEISVTEITAVSQLEEALPKTLFYFGLETLSFKNKETSVQVYAVCEEKALEGPPNPFYAKFFGDREARFGTVYLYSRTACPVIESTDIALDKAMETEEVNDAIAAGKKAKRVSPKKTVVPLIAALQETEPGSKEEAELIAQIKAAPAPKKRVRKQKPEEAFLGEISLVPADESAAPKPKRAKKELSEEERLSKEAKKAEKEKEREEKKAQKEKERAEKKAIKEAEREAKKLLPKKRVIKKKAEASSIVEELLADHVAAAEEEN